MSHIQPPRSGRGRGRGLPSWVVPVGAAGAVGVAFLLLRKPPPASSMPLDAGLSASERLATRFEIAHETNPDNLSELAFTMTPDFPLAAAALNARAKEIRTAKPAKTSGVSVDIIGGFFLTDAIADGANALVDAAHTIPGVDFLGEQLKDFAGTPVGKLLLTAAAGSLTSGLAHFVGPQLASIAFALPGVLRAEPFDKAWLSEFVSRVKKTAEILGGGAGEAAGKAFSSGVQPALDKIMNDPATKDLIAKGADIQKIADAAGVRADSMQAAIDLVKRAGSSFATKGVPSLDVNGVPTLPIPQKDGILFDPATGRAIGVVDTDKEIRAQHAADEVAHIQGAKNIAASQAVQTIDSFLVTPVHGAYRSAETVFHEIQSTPNMVGYITQNLLLAGIKFSLEFVKNRLALMDKMGKRSLKLVPFSSVQAILPPPVQDTTVKREAVIKLAASAKSGNVQAQQLLTLAAKRFMRDALVKKYVALSKGVV